MRWIVALFIALMPASVVAQSAATLVADNVLVTADNRLVAQGNIEAFFDGNRLQAAQITYSQARDQLIIEGPIVITTADGTILTATQATLDPTFENGILLGARLVLNRQLQLAANQINRAEGRYSQLYKTAVTSCNVCQGQSPLWEIRATSVVHDAQEQQLYFKGAQFRIKGVPVAYIPRMRLPDPTLTRATGLLLPRLKTTDKLGIGIKLPYFIKLGDHRDLTVTPYVSNETRTLELRYRQAFSNGDLQIDAAASQDTLFEAARSYVFADGQFELRGGYELSFDIEAASDNDYLVDYGYSDKDRLDSAIRLQNISADRLFSTSLTYFQTQRDDEENASLPPLIADVTYARRFNLGAAGRLDAGASADLAYRYSTQDGSEGRDVGRVGAWADWSKTWVGTTGIVAQAQAGLKADYYQITDDSAFAATGLRTTPHLGVNLSYPLARSGASGARHLVTPTLALAWSEPQGFTPPNEDSTRTEFDAANLFDLDRFAGQDAVETGLRAAIGATWTRIGADGTHSTLTFGRVAREIEQDAFSTSSGLSGAWSDWLLAGQVVGPSGTSLMGRAVFDDDADLTQAEALVEWRSASTSLSAAYLWQIADVAENRPSAVSQFTLDTEIQLNDNWAVLVDTRYDLIANSPARAGLGVQYKNECVTVDLSASRRYSDVSTVEPETSYGLSVSLTGFSTGRSVGVAQAGCRGQ